MSYEQAPSASSVKAAETGCKMGDANLCLNAGNMYFEGIGVKKDARAAYAIFIGGCELGQADACLNAGNLLYNGSEMAQDIVAAHELYVQSCELGAAKGCEYRDVALRQLPAPPRTLSSFPNYSTDMTLADCEAVYEQIGRALSSRTPSGPNGVRQSVSDEAIQWALKYESAKNKSALCPGRASGIVAKAPINLSLTNKPPVSTAVSFGAEQVSQADYEQFMSCAGKFRGGYNILIRLYPTYDEEVKGQLAQQVEAGREIGESLDNIAHDLPIMAPHLNRRLGDGAYRTAIEPFNTMSSRSYLEQEDYYLAHSKLSKKCELLATELVGLQSIFYSAQTSLKD